MRRLLDAIKELRYQAGWRFDWWRRRRYCRRHRHGFEKGGTPTLNVLTGRNQMPVVAVCMVCWEFCDIDPATMQVTFDQYERKENEGTRHRSEGSTARDPRGGPGED